MTQHKCGTCRFYIEAGTQHGSCGNPANPRRDAVALLRPNELGCRAGWGKDYWVDGTQAAADPDQPGSSTEIDAEVTKPIPQVAIAPPMPLPGTAMRRNASGTAVQGLGVANEADMEGGVKRDLTMQGHPELNEQGIPIRNTAKRSSVAEAHRRALARRVKEQKLKEERDSLREVSAPVSTAAFIPEPINPAPRPTPAPVVPTAFTAPAQPLPDLPVKTGFPAVPFAAQHELLPKVEPSAPMMPKASEPPEPARESVAPPEQAVDRVIDTTAQESKRVLHLQAEPPAPLPEEETPTLPVQAKKEPAAMDQSEERMTPADDPEKKSTRYWDAPSTATPYRRIDPPAPRDNQRPVNEVGRPRAEAPAASSERMQRSIRTMAESRRAALPTRTAPEPPAAEPTTQPTPPTASAVTEPITPPAPVVVPPREIDEALLRQLETNWRTSELTARPEQRCGTCRYFRPTAGTQGTCGCTFTQVAGRPVEPGELACLSGLGTWWAAADNGWLESTERRPRRATPLLDALQREYEEELARLAPERRTAR